MNEVISLAQYNDVHTFGIESMREVEELNKALEAGHADPPRTGGGSLRVESLEASLKVLTYQSKHCAFWSKVPKLPAYSTVEEYNQLSSYGADSGVFLPEGILPETNDSGYNRATSLVKFLGTTRSVSHPMTLVRSSIGDVVAQENANGILWMLKQLENALFNGDADMCYLGSSTDSTHREGVEFNGIEKQIDSTQVIDLGGQPLSEGTFADAAQMVASNYGIPSDAFLSFGAHEAYCNLMLPKERIPVSAGPNGDLSVGVNVSNVQTPFGKINLNPDVFLNTGITPPANPTSTSAPASPSAVALASTPMTGTDGVWATHGGTGVYSYSVSACNRYGESAAIVIAADLTVTSDDLAKHAVIEVTLGAVDADAPEYLKLYKTAVGGSIKTFVARIATTSQSGAATVTITDTGIYMGSTSKAYVGELSPQVVAVKQLAPLMKMDLAILAPAIRWMILCYLTFILYAPKKWVRIINIGQ